MVSSGDEQASLRKLRSHMRSRRGGRDSESHSRSRSRDSHHRDSSKKSVPGSEPLDGSPEHTIAKRKTRMIPREEEPQINAVPGEAQPSLISSARDHEPLPRPMERQRGTSLSAKARCRQDSSHGRDGRVGRTGELECLERVPQRERGTTLRRRKRLPLVLRWLKESERADKQAVETTTRELEDVAPARRMRGIAAAPTVLSLTRGQGMNAWSRQLE